LSGVAVVHSTVCAMLMTVISSLEPMMGLFVYHPR